MFEKTRAKVTEVADKALEASNNVAEYGRTIVSMLAALFVMTVTILILQVATGVRRAA